MKKILLIAAALALVSCQKAKQQAPAAPQAEVDKYPELPRTGRMTLGEERAAPKQAKDFCKRHKDFEQC